MLVVRGLSKQLGGDLQISQQEGVQFTLTFTVTNALKEQPNLTFFEEYIDDQGVFIANDISVKAADNMFTELIRWIAALQLLKEQHPSRFNMS